MQMIALLVTEVVKVEVDVVQDMEGRHKSEASTIEARKHT